MWDGTTYVLLTWSWIYQDFSMHGAVSTCRAHLPNLYPQIPLKWSSIVEGMLDCSCFLCAKIIPSLETACWIQATIYTS